MRKPHTEGSPIQLCAGDIDLHCSCDQGQIHFWVLTVFSIKCLRLLKNILQLRERADFLPFTVRFHISPGSLSLCMLHFFMFNGDKQ